GSFTQTCFLYMLATFVASFVERPDQDDTCSFPNPSQVQKQLRRSVFCWPPRRLPFTPGWATDAHPALQLVEAPQCRPPEAHGTRDQAQRVPRPPRAERLATASGGCTRL